MEIFPKINAPFKRYMDGPKKGRLMIGDWAKSEFQYLANNEWEFTEKVDGTNIRIGFNCRRLSHLDNPEFAGRSDAAIIPEPLKFYLQETFTGDLFRKADLNEVVLFGEGYGPKIQGGGKYRDDHSFVLFDVKIGSWWLKREDVNDIAEKLGIESVPIIGYGTLFEAINLVRTGHGRDLAGNKIDFSRSVWGDFEAEGLVCRPKVPLSNRRGERIITKVKSVDFK